MELLGPIIEICKCVGPPMWGYIQYYRKRNTFAKLLDELKSQKNSIEQRLEKECGRGKLQKSEVKEWLANIQKIIVTENIEDMVKHKRFFSGASLGKLIDQGIQEVKDYLKKGMSFDDLVIDATASGIILPTTVPVGEMKTKRYIDEIWGYLMGDEVMKIGVCGMGGVGKTTIMEHINSRLLEESHKFDYIIWVTVSQVVDLIKLQKDIAIVMNEEFHETTDKKRGAGILFKMLKGRKVVLILDDVWEKIQLEELGFLEPTKENGCKLVITTRSLDVCRFMSCKPIIISLLSKSEALKLFLHKAELDISRFPSLKEIVNDVVEQCAGLPHAIVNVASCMKGQYDIREWRNALNELSDNRRSVNFMSEVFEKIKLSYDALKDEKVQHCLLDCALFPENYRIPKNELMSFWIAEGFINEMDDLQPIEDKAHNIMNRLINNCLLLESTDPIERSYVRLHDIVRDMVLMHITSKSPLFMVKAGMNLKELPPQQDWKENLEKVSLINNSIKEIPSYMSPNCPVLSTLLLQENPLQRIPETFFKNMCGLKILNLSKTGIGSLPDSISKLSNLTTLSLKNCSNLTYAPCLGKLLSLKNFDVSDCKNLVEISHEEDKKELILPGLRMLSLKNMPKLKSLCGSNGVMVCDSIQKFEIYNCQKLKKIFSSKVQVGLKYLEEIVVEKCDEMEEIIELDVDTEKKSENQITLPKLRNLILRWMPKLKSICGTNDVMAGDHLQKIEISNCSKLQKILSPSNLLELKHLEEIDVSYCHELEEMIALDVDDEETITKELSVPKLKSLRLKHMLNLKSICGSNGALYVSDYLQRIEIEYCRGLKKILSLSKVLAELTNLEEICVSYCDQVEEVITLGSDKEEIGNKELGLPKLARLILRSMPNLKRIYGNNGVIVSDSLQNIKIRSCPKLKKILSSSKLLLELKNLEEIDVSYCHDMEDLIRFGFDKEEKSNKELSFPKLTNLILDSMKNLKSICGNYKVTVGDSLQKIEIRSCQILKIILSPSKSRLELENLEVIHVEGCEQMEEIITIGAEKGGISDQELSLPKLTKLILVSMKNLKSICGNKGIIVRDSLQNIEIRSCPMLEKILSISKLLVALENLEVIHASDCEKIEEMITIGAAKKGKIERELSLPKLTKLILENMPELKSIYEINGITVGDSLKEIKVEKCHKLRKIISSSESLLELKNLEDIEVKDCEEIKEIIASNIDIEKAESKKKQFSLSKLKKLSLCSMKSLESICGRNGVMVGGSLEQIDVRNCPKLIKIISPSKLLRELKGLQVIKVKRCDKMEEIIASNVDLEEELSLPKLRELILHKMPNLRSINCRSNIVMVCETICAIRIHDCPLLEDFHLSFPLDKNGQPCLPIRATQPSLPKKWCYFDESLWESMTWNPPNAEGAMLPFCFFDPTQLPVEDFERSHNQNTDSSAKN